MIATTNPQATALGEAQPRHTNLRMALVLGAACGVASSLLIPYAQALVPTRAAHSQLPLALTFALAFVQAGILCFLIAWAGLRLGEAVGLDAPFLRAWIGGRALGTSPAKKHFLLAAVVGIVTSAVILLLDGLVFAPHLAAAQLSPTAPHIARWKGALACFYGGISEEVQLRLFFMTTLTWVLAKVTRTRSPAIFFTAILLSALAFGAAHLPAMGQIAALTPMVVTRVILLNGLGGIAFGVLYWRWGLEHAMVAHFCADFVLHVIQGG